MILYLDNNGYVQICENISKFLRNYSEIHACDYLTLESPFSFASDIHKQKNNIDYGVYTCIYALALANHLHSVAVTSLLTARYYIAMMRNGRLLSKHWESITSHASNYIR